MASNSNSHSNEKREMSASPSAHNSFNNNVRNSIPIHCIIEYVTSSKDLSGTSYHESYAIVMSNLPYKDVMKAVLSRFGYTSQEIDSATATIQVKNWKPLALDQLTDDKQATVGEILGEISTLVTLRIKVYNRGCSQQQQSQLMTIETIGGGRGEGQGASQSLNNGNDEAKSPTESEMIIRNTATSLGQNNGANGSNSINGTNGNMVNTNSSSSDKQRIIESASPEQQTLSSSSFAHPSGGYNSLLSSRTPSVSSVNSLSSFTSLARTESNAGTFRSRKADKIPFLVVFKVSGANAITLWPQGCHSDALPPTPVNENHLKVRRRRREFMSSSICSSTSASEDDEKDHHHHWDIMGSLKSLSSPAAIYYKFRLANSADLPPGTLASASINSSVTPFGSAEGNGNGNGSSQSGTDQSAPPSRATSRSPTPTPMKNNLIKVFTLRQPPKDQSGRCEFKPQESRGKYYNPNDFAMFMSEPLKHVRDATFAVDLTLDQNGELEDVGTAHLYLNPQCSTQGTQRAPIIKSGVHVGELVVDFLIIMNPVAYNTNFVLPEWLTRKQPIHAGHRGLGSGLVRSSGAAKPGDYLENTIASFNHAAQSHKFDSIELDVFLTLDGIPTIYHDFDVNLVVENGDVERHQVNDFTLEELRRLKLLSLAEKLENKLELPQLDASNKPFPTLEEVFQNVNPSTGIYVEIKWPQMLENGTYKARKYRELNDFIDKILDVVFKNANGRRIILQSFEPDIVLMMRLKQTQFPVMMLSKGSTDLHGSFLDTRSISVKNGTYYAEAIGIAGIVLVADYYLDLGEDLVKFINEHNLLAHSWGPIDCEENLQYLKRIGVQGFIYDIFNDLRVPEPKDNTKIREPTTPAETQNAQNKTWFFNA